MELEHFVLFPAGTYPCQVSMACVKDLQEVPQVMKGCSCGYDIYFEHNEVYGVIYTCMRLLLAFSCSGLGILGLGIFKRK